MKFRYWALTAVCAALIMLLAQQLIIRHNAGPDPNIKPMVWVEFGDWKGVWCRAEYMDRIRKSWEVVPWDAKSMDQNPRTRQTTAINDDASHRKDMIRATINGGEFMCDDEHNEPAHSMGAVLTHGKLVIGSSVIKNSLMTEGIIAFNTTGSDIYMDTMNGQHQQPSKGPYADTAYKRYNTQYLTLIQGRNNRTKQKLIKPLFGPYQHGKLAHFMLMYNGLVIPRANSKKTGAASSRSILVLGKPRLCVFTDKHGKLVSKRSRDMLILVNHNTDKGCLIDEVRQFIDNRTDNANPSLGVLRQSLNKMMVHKDFSIDSVMMLDGGGSSQVHYTDNQISHHYGNLTDDVRVSPRPIPDYIKLEADWK